MKIVKEEKLINENERGDCQEFVMHGSNISGAVKIMKENNWVSPHDPGDENDHN